MKCKISSDISTLNDYHKKYDWIPGENNIRPTTNMLNEKEAFIYRVHELYSCIRDYILIEIFNFPKTFGEYGKFKLLDIRSDNSEPNYRLRKNKFPYDISNETNHYIMWYNSHISDIILLSDNKITWDINNSLLDIVGNNNFEFVWYENPKMNIPDIYHIQVFWKELI